MSNALNKLRISPLRIMHFEPSSIKMRRCPSSKSMIPTLQIGDRIGVRERKHGIKTVWLFLQPVTGSKGTYPLFLGRKTPNRFSHVKNDDISDQEIFKNELEEDGNSGRV